VADLRVDRGQLSADRARCESKAVGCLIGLAVGDALGDLGRDQEHRKRYGMATELHQSAKSTDDTEFALLTARALLDCAGDLTAEAVLAAWQRYILDQGGVFERGGQPLYGAVANLRRGILPPLSGRDNVAHYDDGAAMRVAPIGIACAGDPRRAAQFAALDAQISHYADGVWAAQAVAAAVAVAMVDATTEEVLAAARAQIPEDSWLGRGLERAMRICDAAEGTEDAWEPLHSQLWTPSHSAAAEAIPQALAIVRMTGGDFRRGLFWAANFGRDADTISAVVGALAGARHGAQAIPDGWAEIVRRPSGVCLRFAAQEDIPTLARQLAELIR
jgi:ADP-ribosylglycohydrolase